MPIQTSPCPEPLPAAARRDFAGTDAAARPASAVPPAVPTRAERFGDALAARIVSGALTPGQRLDEQTLAAEAGISRTPVREALRHLAATGLVELRPRRGAVVASPDPCRLRGEFELLAELEALCARWSALRMPPRERARLEATHRDMASLVRQGDRAGYRDANRALHAMVYEGARNGHLADVALATHRRLAPFRGAQFDAPRRLAASHEEHGLVVAAVLRGDAEGAAMAMRRHIQRSGQSWESIAVAGRAGKQEGPAVSAYEIGMSTFLYTE